jgi:cyclin B
VLYLSKAEQSWSVAPDYFKIQSDIKEHMREVLLGWLVNAHLHCKLHPETLFIAVHILDGYLSRVAVSRCRLQLVGITALWMACKFEETYQVPSIDTCVQLCNCAFSKQDMLATEAHIAHLLNFQLPLTT